MTRFTTDIRPMSDLQSGGADIVRQAQETGRPIALTRHGRAVAVVLSAEAFDELAASPGHYPYAPAGSAAERVAIAEADADFEAGRHSSHDEVVARIHHRLRAG